MKKGIELLRQSIGSVVEKVAIDVLFYDEEDTGSVGNVILAFKGGKTFFLGCAGDGSLTILLSNNGDVGVAPGFEKKERLLAGLSGHLSWIQSGGNYLDLTINGHKLEVKNDDDEIVLSLNRRPLEKSILSREISG